VSSSWGYWSRRSAMSSWAMRSMLQGVLHHTLSGRLAFMNPCTSGHCESVQHACAMAGHQSSVSQWLAVALLEVSRPEAVYKRRVKPQAVVASHSLGLSITSCMQ
jgi:hypothetical protein